MGEGVAPFKGEGKAGNGCAAGRFAVRVVSATWGGLMLPILVFAAAVDPSGAATAVPTPKPVVITNADWAAKPVGDDFARFYPDAAQKDGLDGQATIQCSVTVEGKLEPCSVTDENPPASGFGSAALKIGTKFKMRPQTRDGVPVSGGTIRIPITFRLPVAGTLSAIRAVVADVAEGHAEIDCRTTVSGGLDNCLIYRVDPGRPELRELALKVAAKLQMPEGTRSKLRVMVPINFAPTSARTP